MYRIYLIDNNNINRMSSMVNSFTSRGLDLKAGIKIPVTDFGGKIF